MIKNQNVKIEKFPEGFKITNMQNNSTPGIKYKFDLNENSKYSIIFNIDKNINLHGKILLWISNLKYETLCSENIKYLSPNQSAENYFSYDFDTKDYKEFYIGLLFSECNIDDFFILSNLKIINDNNQLIYNFVYVQHNNINKVQKQYEKHTEQLNTIIEDPENYNIVNKNVKIANRQLEYKTNNSININTETNKNEIIVDTKNNNENLEISNHKIKNIEDKKYVLIIVDFVYLGMNLSENRFKFLSYLSTKNENIICAGTGMKFFKSGMHIRNLLKILKIKPYLIVHGNNFLKPNLLVSGLKEYNECKKALIIEDMHDTDLISNVIKNNGIDFVLYHYNCPQFDRIKLLNRGIRFVNYPHYVDTNIFKNYKQIKTYDIVLYGCLTKNVYPFRNRLFNLIHGCQKFKVLYIPFPGYYVKNRNSVICGEKLARMINKAYIGIATSSICDYFIKKYIEIPACNTMIAGNIPNRYNYVLKDNIIELRPEMTDSQIINTLMYELKDKKKLVEKTGYLHDLIINNFSYENGDENFNKFVGLI